MRTFHGSIGFLFCFAIATWSGLRIGMTQEIGFSERFALAQDRDAVLRELIPGTDPHFYYHCLHCQTVGKVAEARAFLDAWIAKSGLNEQTKRMQTRQFLLEYRSNSQATFDYLRSEFGINVDHSAPRKNEASELQLKLDPNVLDWNTILRSHSSNPSAVEHVALAHLAPYLDQPATIRSWLERIDRVDCPGLLEIVERELALPDSRGFGWAAIHNLLTAQQLLDLQKRVPKLIESNAFVQARLRRIRPNDDASIEDREVLRDHLTALEAFVAGLPESQNSLTASVLYNRLLFDERDGNMDRERFLRYVKLPKNRPYLNQEYVARQNRRPQVNLGANYKGETLLDPIGDDTTLVYRYLEHFFKTDNSIDAFSSILDRDYLKKVFASTKILYGIGDPKIYYAQLSPDEQRELQSRVELKFTLNNPTYYRPSDTVRLTLDLKNIPELLVKVYRLNARNILMQRKQPIATDLDLDGLVANVEKRIAYAQSAELRHREVLEMPELVGGGVWVVDVLAGGQRSRTLIHKGHLQAMQRMTDAGDAIRIFDADGKHVPTAKVLFGAREFGPDGQGDIVIPFGEQTTTDSLILFDGSVASVQQFVHNGENYELQAGFLLPPQSLLASSRATVAVRSNLLCNGQLISLAQLEKPILTITSTDLDGISATQTIPDLKLADNNEWTHTFLVPQRLASIVMTLSGQVLKLSSETRMTVSASHTVVLNSMAKTPQTRDFYLTQTDTGNLLEVRGRNGEPASRIAVQLEFKLFGLIPTKSVRLATNEEGLIDLGMLPNVERFKASADAISAREFELLTAVPNWPANYHVLSGKPIEAVWNAVDRPDPVPQKIGPNAKIFPRISLVEFRSGIVYADHSNKVLVENGLVKVNGLEPGSYRITDYHSGQSMQIRVVQGEKQGDMLVSQARLLETNRTRTVHVKNIKLTEEKLQVQLGNQDKFTRLHIVANAFEAKPYYGTSLPAPTFPMAAAARMRIPSFYLNSLKLDEEYQYVLQRQFLSKYIGNLLPQPSVILNPWELAVTQNASQSAAAGDPISGMAPGAPVPGIALKSRLEKQLEPFDGAPEYEFLKRGSVLLTNGRCDDDGLLSVDRNAFAGLTSITVIVVHPSGSTYRTIHLPLIKAREVNDRRLAKAFSATDRLAEIESVRILPKSDKIDLGDAASTRVKIYSSIPDVFQLYRTLQKNRPEFSQFECLTRWPSLAEEQKERHYSDLACHEMNLFLLVHDPKFFDRVIRPYLANKMQKQFMDDFVLGSDVAKYVQPWRLAQLNAVERVLLAKRIASQSSSTKRWMGDLVFSLPVNSAEQSALFETGLMSLILTDSGLMDAAGHSDARGEISDSLSFSFNKPAEAFFESESLLKQTLSDLDGKETSGMSLSRALSSKRGTALGLEKAKRLYQSLESTRKWAESNYYRLPLASQSAELVRPNAFWLDYLNHLGDGPFLTKHIELTSSNFHEAILALAVIGLPLEAKPAVLSVEQGRLLAATSNESVVFVQGLERMEQSADPATILTSQSIFLASEKGEDAKPVQNQSLIKGEVYRLRVVLTNPSASIVRVNVLQQIPQGAIALENAKVVSGRKLDLAPFATQELSTKFYFPQSGLFEHFGSQIAIGDKIAITVPSTSLKVLDNPDSVDESSWSYVASWGTDEQVLAYLKKANLFKTNLDSIAWRMANKNFFENCLSRLSEYGIFNPALWAYAIKHNDAPRLRELLESHTEIVRRVSPSFDSDIMKVEPVDRLTFEHLDFRPMIMARTHQLGPKRVILNDGLSVQYAQMMAVISHQKEIDSEQRLALVYYMILQNRTEEAISHLHQIDSTRIQSKLQHDYFAAYLDMTQGKYDEADARSQKYIAYPNPRWRDWFSQVRSQVAERKAIQAGLSVDVAKTDDWKTNPQNRLLAGAREQQNLSESASLPILDLFQDADKIVLRHRNLENIEVKFYLMDIELLFSRNPFAQHEGGRLSMTEPNLVDAFKTEKSAVATGVNLVIPDKLKNKNVMIEVTGGGLTRNLILYANSLVVNHSPNLGRLQVLSKQGLQPLEGAYIKVYSRDTSGKVNFYKDGYTDLRGQFDYTSLSTNDLDSTQRFSILVLHPEHGTIVRESEPPKR